MDSKIKAFSYVTKGKYHGYFFVNSIDGNTASIIGMRLSEMKDTIIFYSETIDIDTLSYVDESFININGPLSILRENMIIGINDVFIEGMYA